MTECPGVWDHAVTNEYGHVWTVRKLLEAYAAECRRSAALLVDAGRRERRAALAAMDCAAHGEPVPAEVVIRELLKAIDGQDKAMRRPRSPFAACLHDGDCGLHDGLSEQLKAEIAQALGIAPGQGELFAAGPAGGSGND